MYARGVLVAYLLLIVGSLSIVLLSAVDSENRREVTASELVRALEDRDVSQVVYIEERSQFEWIDDGERFVAVVPAQRADELVNDPKVTSVQDGPRSVLAALTVGVGLAVVVSPWTIQIGLAAHALNEEAGAASRRALWAIGLLMIPVVVPILYLVRRDRIQGTPLVPIVAGLTTAALVGGFIFAIQNPVMMRNRVEGEPVGIDGFAMPIMEICAGQLRIAADPLCQALVKRG